MLGPLAKIGIQNRELFGRGTSPHQAHAGPGGIIPALKVPANVFARDPHTLVLAV